MQLIKLMNWSNKQQIKKRAKTSHSVKKKFETLALYEATSGIVYWLNLKLTINYWLNTKH
jgi:hypothetical protein